MNRYLFGLVYRPIAEEDRPDVDDIHDLMTQWFLPQPRLRRLSNWPDGDVRTMIREVWHTSKLTPEGV